MNKVTKCITAAIACAACVATVHASTVAYWRFEGSATINPSDPGNFLYDSSGNGNNLQQTGSSTVTQIASPFLNPVPQTQAANDFAAQIAGPFNDGISSNTQPTISDQVTIEAFFSPDALFGRTSYLFGYGASTGVDDRSIALGIADNNGTGSAAANTLFLLVSDDGDNNVLVASGLPEIEIGKLYYVAATYDATIAGGINNASFRFDNLTDGGTFSSTGSSGLVGLHQPTSPSSSLNIGALWNGANDLDGLIDEVRFTSGLLSSSELLIFPEPGTAALAIVGASMVMYRRTHKVNQ